MRVRSTRGGSVTHIPRADASSVVFQSNSNVGNLAALFSPFLHLSSPPTSSPQEHLFVGVQPLPPCPTHRPSPTPHSFQPAPSPSFASPRRSNTSSSPPPSPFNMLRLSLVSALAIASAAQASVISTSVFPNSACAGASSSLGGLVGVGRVTLSNGEVETHCGCPSVRSYSLQAYRSLSTRREGEECDARQRLTVQC